MWPGRRDDDSMDVGPGRDTGLQQGSLTWSESHILFLQNTERLHDGGGVHACGVTQGGARA